MSPNMSQPTVVENDPLYGGQTSPNVKYGSNVYNSPAAAKPLMSATPGNYTTLPAIGGGLVHSGGAYGR